MVQSLIHLVPQQMNLHHPPKMFPSHDSIGSHCQHLLLLLNLAERITWEVGGALSLHLLCDIAGSGEHSGLGKPGVILLSGRAKLPTVTQKVADLEMNFLWCCELMGVMSKWKELRNWGV